MAFDIITNSTEFDKEILLNQFFATFGENYTQQEKDLFTQAIKDAVAKYPEGSSYPSFKVTDIN